MASDVNAPARIVVVDDEPSITDAVATALRYEGFETREVATGRAAEQAIDEFRPDLIVLDVMLPDLDGFEIAQRLRDGRHRTPVIFLTARDATEDKLAGLAVGDDYVTKPEPTPPAVSWRSVSDSEPNSETTVTTPGASSL